MIIILGRLLASVILTIYSFSALSPTLYISQPVMRQGEFITVSLSLPKPPKTLEGIFYGKNIKFFKRGTSNKYYALIGADVIAPPGIHPLEVNVDYGDGKSYSSIDMIFIQEGTFRKENLRFGRKSDIEEKVKKRVYNEWVMIQSILQAGEESQLWNGEFIDPVKGKTTSRFGNQRIFNKELQTVHTGTDFRAPVGTPVRAPNGGRVAFAGTLYYCGNTLLIDHGAGLFSQYCHLNSIRVKNGGIVKRGDIVASSGNSGRTTGPHLHWAIHVNGARVDPLYVKKHSSVILPK